VWRTEVKLSGEIAKKDTVRLIEATEALLKENSALRVRDSNVTAHSLNVMAVNEDLQGRRCGTCKHWERDHQYAERDHAVCNQIARQLAFETADDQPEFAWTEADFACGFWEAK
jgi:hypothetical protein